MALPVLTFPPASLPVEQALDRSRAALVAVEGRELAVVQVTELEAGPVIVLGALQHAGRVAATADTLTKAPFVRRTTSGTGFACDGGVLCSIALGAPAITFPDVSPRTVLNRCVRPLLAGFRALGIDLAYLGREWLARRRQAAAVLAFDMSPSGAVLIEAFLTARGSFAIPQELASAIEASCDRYRGRATLSLEDLGAASSAVRDPFVAGVVERLGAVRADVVEPPLPDRSAHRVVSQRDPIPEGLEILPPRSVPIGVLDVARSSGGGSWVGGDVLAPTFALGFEQPFRPDTLPMEGAVWADVTRARDAAR